MTDNRLNEMIALAQEVYRAHIQYIKIKSSYEKLRNTHHQSLGKVDPEDENREKYYEKMEGQRKNIDEIATDLKIHLTWFRDLTIRAETLEWLPNESIAIGEDMKTAYISLHENYWKIIEPTKWFDKELVTWAEMRHKVKHEMTSGVFGEWTEINGTPEAMNA